MTSDKTSFKARWRRGDPLFGIFSRLTGEEAHEAFGFTSVDVVVIDAEHGNFDRERLSRCVLAAKLGGVTVLVRLPDMDPKGVQHAINVGADGVMIPHVNSAEKLRALSTFAKTTAIERAFAGAGRASRHRTLAWPDFRRDLSERLLFIAQLDEPAGVGAATEVAAIDSVDGIFLGSIGFALAMGPQGSRASVDTELGKICDAAKARGKSIAISLPEQDAARQWAKTGINFFVIDSDLAILRKGIEQRIGEFREALAKPG
jgi:2-keto-3-deoxy-L-rhamnonate aldolase RhmA